MIICHPINNLWFEPWKVTLCDQIILLWETYQGTYQEHSKIYRNTHLHMVLYMIPLDNCHYGPTKTVKNDRKSNVSWRKKRKFFLNIYIRNKLQRLENNNKLSREILIFLWTILDSSTNINNFGPCFEVTNYVTYVKKTNAVQVNSNQNLDR